MGDISQTAICQAFVDEFKKDIENKFSMKGDFVIEQTLDIDSNHMVRMSYIIRDSAGDGFRCWGDEVFYTPNTSDEEIASVLVSFIYGNDDEKYESVLSRVRDL